MAYYGNNIANPSPVATPVDCQVRCQQNDECKYWTYGHNHGNAWFAGKCFIKNARSNVQQNSAFTSGPKNC